MIGVLGFDCSGFSYRRILAMWISHQIDKWNHTASIRHIIAQSQSSKSVPFSDFHPMIEKKKSARFTPDDIETVKSVYSVFSKNKD